MRSTATKYSLMAPLFEHYGVQLWTPETGGRVDFTAAHHERELTMLGVLSRREITRTRIRLHSRCTLPVGVESTRCAAA